MISTISSKNYHEHLSLVFLGEQVLFCDLLKANQQINVSEETLCDQTVTLDNEETKFHIEKSKHFGIQKRHDDDDDDRTF